MTNESSPLNGIKIVDLSRVLSGPFATMTLADLGADVVKVERPGTGDDTRSFGPPFVAGASTYFLSVNRGKRSICLDLKAEADREVLKRLVACADVVVENFRPGVMERLGLDYARLKAEHPALIMCSISGFGQAKGGPGYDLMVQGLSGIPSITGAGDLGSFVDVSMLDGQLSLLTYHASAWLNGGQAPKAIGNAHPSIHPFCAYAAQDQHFNLAVGNDKLFVQLCEALGLDLHLNCLFENNADRVKNRSALNAILGPVFLAQPAEYWLELLKQAGVPCGPILSVEQALKAATLTTHAHPSAEGLVQTVALPFSVGDAPRSSERGAPALGGDQQEVLKDWLGEP
jgi:crotonobetainyl-CoA:carnitine CoA-transferase CaiB-like acyl-CoA transferase